MFSSTTLEAQARRAVEVIVRRMGLEDDVVIFQVGDAEAFVPAKPPCDARPAIEDARAAEPEHDRERPHALTNRLPGLAV
ncbi:MAG: hypothetical protein U5Q44_12635 [Dehalococcoidia bacterium]|nr:hypothetical protein [Dehalococcoidia bacterium]